MSCEVIRDKRTKESLQYAFIEFENQKDSEQAYFKMSGVLIDDHRIHVDFSQSVGHPAPPFLILAFICRINLDCRYLDSLMSGERRQITNVDSMVEGSEVSQS